MIKFLNFFINHLGWLVNEFIFCSSYPAYILISKCANFVSKANKFLAWHNLNCFLFLFAVKTFDALAFLMLAYFTNYFFLVLNLVRLVHLFNLILFNFRSTRMTIFLLWAGCWHVWRFNLIMFILHVGVECGIWSISLSTILNRTEKFLRYFLIFTPMNFRLAPIHIIKVLH